MPTCHQIMLCTCPDKDTAEKIARLLVMDQLAACVNILPGILSVYTWQGQVESAQEHLLLIKSRKDHYPSLEKAIRDNHPYEIPEIIAVPVEAGLPEYLNWIDSCLSSS
ncbi:divalent-cation tolerance protein CutA [Methylobacter sp. BlB1]|uniref:divalent-cation tolerance protein CutA n=1 Tax=Methylobacter sp. BlB1 TaxID=2785914 RepID=UPI0018940472|nr:divalent-cation tolerance protein CutA [Methylobacter sp. BlB1]